MKRWFRRIAIFLGLVVVVLIVGIAGVIFSFRWSVPSYDATENVAGLSAPATIRRDRNAIPHILARSHDDAAFGLGYAHAQDRLFQMEMSRRYIQGRLSELFGETTVSADRDMRTLGLYTAAELALPHLAPETRRVLESYAAGVNAFLATHRGNLPIEFTLAGDREPEPWRPADSIAVLKGMAAMLSGNANAEAARVRLLPVLGRAGMQDFISPFSEVALPSYLDGLFATTQLGEAFGIPDITASNNWVVGGAHAERGKPLLANDPHLGFTIPSTWYLAHMAIPDEDIVGGTLPGIPGIVAGRNRHVAWGLTNTGPDTEDLYLEKLHPDSDRQYQTPTGWAEFESHVETIQVRFGAPVNITVRRTRHGPVMEDSGPYEGVAPPGYVLALAWTALAPDDTTMDALVGINRAQDVQAFRAATELFVAPMQNLVYADDAGATGNIGLVLPGRVPIRTELNDSHGLVPAPGWDAAYDWQGYIPVSDVAEIVNPVSDRIATANNKTVPDGYAHILTLDWEPPFRHDRIDALLAGNAAPQTSHQSIASFRAIQLDTVDTYALALKKRLLAAGPFQGAAAEAATALTAWDGGMLRAKHEPLLFSAWARALARRLYADELGPSFGGYWGYRAEFTLRVLDDVDGQSRWCDDKATRETEDCASRIRLALDDALAEIGADTTWGDVHRSFHAARPFGTFPWIGGFFNREAITDGGAFTVLRADHRMGAREPYRAIHGAGYRGIYDLADAENSLYMISTGQSGNVFSPNYDDLLPGWANGEYVTIPIAPDSIERTSIFRTELQPVGDASER